MLVDLTIKAYDNRIISLFENGLLAINYDRANICYRLYLQGQDDEQYTNYALHICDNFAMFEPGCQNLIFCDCPTPHCEQDATLYKSQVIKLNHYTLPVALKVFLMHTHGTILFDKITLLQPGQLLVEYSNFTTSDGKPVSIQTTSNSLTIKW